VRESAWHFPAPAAYFAVGCEKKYPDGGQNTWHAVRVSRCWAILAIAAVARLARITRREGRPQKKLPAGSGTRPSDLPRVWRSYARPREYPSGRGLGPRARSAPLPAVITVRDRAFIRAPGTVNVNFAHRVYTFAGP
jgi:hypothetical protein